MAGIEPVSRAEVAAATRRFAILPLNYAARVILHRRRGGPLVQRLENVELLAVDLL